MFVICPVPNAEAQVTRMVITSREVVAGGMSFGETGPYEKLRGTVIFQVDPTDPHNHLVFDVDKVPTDADGLFRFTADFIILKPVALEKGNNTLFFEANNKGDLLFLNFFDDSPGDSNFDNPSTQADFAN